MTGPAMHLARPEVLRMQAYVSARSIAAASDTLRLLEGFAKLQELTLNDSKITDTGLEMLKALPSLETLRLARTGITPEGVSEFLASPPPRLRQIDVSGNGIPTSILRRWKNAGNIPTADPPTDSPAPPERQYVN